MASFIGIGIGVAFNNLKTWAAYWAANTSFYATGRSGLTIPDDYGNDAKILPVAFRGNGTVSYRKVSGNFFSGNDWVLYMDVVLNGTTLTKCFCSQQYFWFNIDPPNSKWVINMSDGTNNRSFDISFATLPLTARKYAFKLVHDQDGSTTLYESDIQVGTASGTFVNIANGNVYFGSNNRDNNIIDNTICFNRIKIYSDLAETTVLRHYIFTGGSAGEWDLSGNNVNLECAYLSPNVYNSNIRGFCNNGSTFMLDNGWALWQKAASQDIYVPIGGIATAPVVGYTLTKNYEGSATKINMAPCLIGFNETGSAATALEIFDRSNTTRQTAASRASDYYDATSLATRSRYHISEVYPHEVFTTLFESDYQDTVFTSISKIGTDFSLNAFRGYTEKQTGKYLIKIKEECQIDRLLTVGTNKNVRTIKQAITRAYDDYTITIDTGTYNEFLDLTTKKLNLVGLGTLETIIRYSTTLVAKTTIDIATDSTFSNLIISNTSDTGNRILQIIGCNPIFINCTIDQLVATAIMNAILINTGAVVTMTNCNIDLLRGGACVVEDSSILNFTGGKWKINLLISGTARANINVDEFWTDSTASAGGVKASGDSETYLQINTREVYFNNATGLEYAAGIYGAHSYVLSGNAYLKLSGNQITGATDIKGAGNVVLFKDIISTLGNFRCGVVAGITTALATFDNCQIVLDTDNDVSGWHIIEDAGGCLVNIINGSVLEFSGHQGNWLTMGSPVISIGKIYIRNSSIIDNINDNIPFGTNYTGVIFCRQIDAENAIITNQNWDTVGINYCITMVKDVGVDLQIRLKNVVLNNSENNISPIGIANTNALDVTDYYCEDNVIYNSTAYKMSVANGDPATIYAALIAACPD